jgi:hypothetical protein
VSARVGADEQAGDIAPRITGARYTAITTIADRRRRRSELRATLKATTSGQTM